MSRLAHFIPKKQFCSLPVSGGQSFRYVEIIASDMQSNNVPQSMNWVDKPSLKKSWVDFYSLSKEWGHEQCEPVQRFREKYTPVK